jgi:hypothetical protein
MTYISSLRELYPGALLLALFVAIGAAVPQELAAGELPALCCVCNDGTCAVNSGCATYCVSKGGVLCQTSGPCLSPCASNCACSDDADCNDGNVCTTDRCEAPDCDGAEGAELLACNTLPVCEHYNNTLPCNDGNPCTEGDTCSAGACKGTPKKCSDGIKCTDDTCDASGNCRNTPNDGYCDDSNVCTTDVCAPTKGCVGTFEDSDGDGICNAQDPHPSIFDPTGCLYDETTGRVIPGGLVTPSGPGTIHVGLTGANGCYQFSVTGLPADPNAALYTLSVTLPPNCVRSTACLEDPNAPLDPTGQPSPLILGPFGVGGHINPHDCGSNPLYLSFELSAGDPTVLNNNIPLQCEAEPVPAPAMSTWGLRAVVLLLLVSAFVALRVRRNPR